MMRELKTAWPVAYAEVSCSKLQAVNLKEHLVSTARLVIELFSERLDYLEQRYKDAEQCIGSIKDIAYLAGLLHDLGKASVYYLNTFIKKTAGSSYRSRPLEECQESKLQFTYHEYIAPIIIIYALRNELSSHAMDSSEARRMKNAYYTISRIIVRHHAAMAGRHPAELLSSGKGPGKHSKVLDVLRGLCNKESKIEDLLRELKGVCTSGFCIELLEKIRRNLGAVCKDPKSAVVEINAVKAFELMDYCGISEYDSYRIVSTISGFLIVADNMAASYCENRASDDESTPAYIEIWGRELKNKLSKLKELKDEYLSVRCRWP